MSRPAGRIYLEEIGGEKNQEMLQILEDSPIETRALALSFERRPDVLALPGLFSERVNCVGLLRDGELLGFAMLMYRNLYVNGQPRLVMYFGNAHVRREARGQGFIYRVADFLFRIKDDRSDLGYAVVMSGNRAAERFIGRRRADYPNFPFSRVIGAFCAMNIPIMTRKKESREFQVGPATPDDIEAMVSLLQAEFRPRLFAPVIDREIFLRNLGRRPGFSLTDYYVARRGKEIVGTCAAWDIEPLKQTRIVRYGTRMKFLKAVHGLVARLAGFPLMPKAGSPLRAVTLTDCAIRERNPDIFEAMLRKIYNDYRERGYNLLIFGGCSNDPLLGAAKRFFSLQVTSHIVLFATDQSWLEEGRVDTSLPYIDVAML